MPPPLQGSHWSITGTPALDRGSQRWNLSRPHSSCLAPSPHAITLGVLASSPAHDKSLSLSGGCSLCCRPEWSTSRSSWPPHPLPSPPPTAVPPEPCPLPVVTFLQHLQLQERYEATRFNSSTFQQTQTTSGPTPATSIGCLSIPHSLPTETQLLQNGTRWNGINRKLAVHLGQSALMVVTFKLLQMSVQHLKTYYCALYLAL